MWHISRGPIIAAQRLRTSSNGPLLYFLKTIASHGSPETLDKHYVDYFNRCEIDGWEIRQGMNNLLGMDLVPDPEIIEAALRACRRVNDIALAIRWLEACKDKCGNNKKEIYPYLLEKIRPTLNELSIPTPEDLKYDKPQLALKSVYDM